MQSSSAPALRGQPVPRCWASTDIACWCSREKNFPATISANRSSRSRFIRWNGSDLIPTMKASAFVRKYSIQFAAPSGKVSQPFYFFNRYDRNTVAQTWQVLRSEFDQILLDNAREKGAEVREETAVNELIWEDTRVAGVRAQHRNGTLIEYRAPITLDCSGKEAFTTVQQGWRMRDPYLNKIAVWTYYQGAKRDPESMKALPRSPTCRRKAGSGTSRSTTTWSASALSPRANISRATA